MLQERWTDASGKARGCRGARSRAARAEGKHRSSAGLYKAFPGHCRLLKSCSSSAPGGTHRADLLCSLPRRWEQKHLKSHCRTIPLTFCIILQMLRLSPLTNTALRRTPLLLPASSAVFAARARLLHTSHPLYLDTDRPQPSNSTYPPPSISQATRRRIDTSNNGPSASPADPTPPITPPPVEARLPRRKITSVNELPERFGKNQIIAVPDQVKKELEEVMKVFKAPVRFAFAYGSGVFRQSGYTAAVSISSRRSSRLGAID